MPGTRRQPRTNLYSTQQVLQSTMMARYTLMRYVKDGRFPKPAIKAGDIDSRGADWYSKKDVDKWLKDNSDLILWKRKRIEEDITLTISADDLKKIRKASEVLMCDIEPFIIEAAIWKAKLILKQTEMNTNYY